LRSKLTEFVRELLIRVAQKDRAVAAGVAATIGLTATWGWRRFGSAGIIPAMAIGSGALAGLQLETFRRLNQRQQWAYAQTEALFSLFATVPFRRPLPPMRGWAISPDFAVIIVRTVLDQRPALIVETGSGISTLIAAYCLEQVGAGRIVSLDHDAEFAAATRHLLKEHGLETFVEVRHAPLANTPSGHWYKQSAWEDLKHIDLAIVDGPSSTTRPLARYPVVPLLGKLLSPKAVILVDDADRSDERAMVNEWVHEGLILEQPPIATEKGVAILRRGVSLI
jgi:predicted O-methyltransferase YrrM